ncbi:MAG: four helix bundle protein [Rickettsiales bacterium]|jgi:four helix bundle protein|nr:four helix bundle protein [Rickettsiales bacterium]
MNAGPLKDKSNAFADRIVKLYAYLKNEKKESVISKQILRSGTSIGANISEAIFSCSRKEFVQKLKISEKEFSETKYWLERLKNGNFITNTQFESLLNDCKEIGRILSASIRTVKINTDEKITS